jgi:hypothetical protein
MKKNFKLLVLGLVLVMAVSAIAVFAADKTTTAATTKPTVKTVSTTAVATPAVKLTQSDVTAIALKAYKDAKVLDIKLTGKVYFVKIQTAKGNRTLQIGGNSGKILKNTADSKK